MMREMHGVFVAVNFHALGDAIVLIFKPGKAARIARPHIPFSSPLGDPFRQHFARPPRLTDAKGEHARLKRVRHAGHRADQRIAIGGIGDRAVDHLGQRRLFQQRHPGHRISDIPFQTF